MFPAYVRFTSPEFKQLENTHIWHLLSLTRVTYPLRFTPSKFMFLSRKDSSGFLTEEQWKDALAKDNRTLMSPQNPPT